MFAAFALIPTLPIYLARLGTNEREIGVLVGVFSISALISRFLAGGCPVEILRKKCYDICRFTLCPHLSFLYRAPSFLAFFRSEAYAGNCHCMYRYGSLALIIKTIPLAYRGQGLGYLLLAPPLSLAIVPTFSISLINQYSFTVLFLLCTGLSLCSLLLSWNVKGEQSAATDMDTLRPSIHFIEWKIVAPATISILQSIIWGALMAFFPLYAIQCGVMNPGHFFSAVAIMMITGRALGGRVVDTTPTVRKKSSRHSSVQE